MEVVRELPFSIADFNAYETRRLCLVNIFEILYRHFGPQYWWPADSPFEMIVGAILTQCTTWSNVEKAIDRLKSSGMLSLESLHHADIKDIEELIKPSGYFHQKARKLKSFVSYLMDEWNGELETFLSQPIDSLRRKLLGIYGIGPETADSIILYGAHKPVFVVDQYTYRIVYRHGWFREPFRYDKLQSFFMEVLEPNVTMFQEYHALVVCVGKMYCCKKPRCEKCPLGQMVVR